MAVEQVKRPYIVGIDLGTSNTVVAFAAPDRQDIELFAIEQLVGLGQVATRPLLPSVRYHPATGEIDPGELKLPWTASDAGETVIGGRLALELGSQVPGRLVASAKSWLSHAGVDRTAAILPWGAGDEVAHVSPLEASASYLGHVRAAWLQRFPQAPLEEQQLVLTVPASFDEGARALTLQAARLAGLPRLRLLEEPQAAFYDWLYRHRDDASRQLADTRLLLVCDVGGGTTDLTLIQVSLNDGEAELTRVGVGDHLMLGGDNMDLALAHLVESRLPASDGRLSAARFAQLGARCRAAKEQLFAADAPDSVSLTLLGGGSRLIGGARSVDLQRGEVSQVIVDGFLPRIAVDQPLQQRRAAIVEFGLPYPADPAITRHLAAFLRRHADVARSAVAADAESQLPIPDTLLLNGGVFRAQALAARLQETLADWRGAPLRLLDNDDPEVAVARGAVASALLRAGQGRRIGGGSARSYFLVIDGDGVQARGVCLLPRGTEEGHEIRLVAHTFSLRLGQPVRFHLASSIADTRYQPGDLSELADDDCIRLPPIACVVQPRAGTTAREVRVQLMTTMTEIGTLELHCVSVDDAAQRWLLEFQLRGEASETAVPAAVLPPRFAQAVQAIEQVFGVRSPTVDSRDVRRLRGQLEHLLGKRDDWELPLLRALFDALLQRTRRRRRSPEHERLWLNLAGFCLRPGLGDALDDWRIEQLCRLLEQGIEYVNESQNWSEWWTLWRRVAGGLPAEVQQQLLDSVLPALRGEAARNRSRSSQAMAGSHDDMWRLVASLERLPVERKRQLGESLLDRLLKTADKSLASWAIGRIGARQALYGSVHQVVPPATAESWLAALLAIDWKKVEPAAFAATQIARLTGDRSRDVSPSVREQVLARLMASNANPSWIAQVKTIVDLDRADQRRAFGESLPAGLRLITSAVQNEPYPS